MNKWNMIVNVGRCENCNNCVIAARDEYSGNDFPGYAAPAPAVGDPLIRIKRRVQGGGHMVETTYLPVMCNHCDDAPCVQAGRGAVTKRADGIVLIDPLKAKGRKDIVKSCPYGAIVWNEESQLPQTWIFDAHLLDQGWGAPRCQQSCPTGVFETVRVDDQTMARRARDEGLTGLRAELGTKPRVWYRDIDRWRNCFIGGSVSAPVAGRMECLVDAEAVLWQGGSRLAETRSDAFGDFKFAGLHKDSGSYRVEIRHPLGRAERVCELGESQYLGEFVLSES